MKNIRDGIKDVVKKGDVSLGGKSVVNALLTQSPKLVVVSDNCPWNLHEDIVYYSWLSDTSVIQVDVPSLELGSICGKPYPVSALAVMDAGDSSIMDNIKKKVTQQ